MDNIINAALNAANEEAKYAAIQRAKQLIVQISRCREQREELALRIMECQESLKKLTHEVKTADQVLGS